MYIEVAALNLCLVSGPGSCRSQLVAETKRQALTQITGPGLARGISHGKSAIATGKRSLISIRARARVRNQGEQQVQGNPFFCVAL